MAVAYISDADQTGTGTTITFTSYAVSGTNPTIILTISYDAQPSNGATVSSVVCGAGLSGTTAEVKLQRNNQGGNETVVSIWKITAPSGTGTITATLSASLEYRANAILMQGASQSDPAPVADAVSNTGVTSPMSLTPTNLTANDAAVCMGGNARGGDGPTVSTGTETFNNNAGNINAAAGYHLGTGAIAVSWGITDSLDTMVAVRVAAAAGGNSSSVSPSVSPSVSLSPSRSPSPSSSQSASPSPTPSSSPSPSPAGIIVMERTVFYYVD